MNILITSGGTSEKIDDVRFITNFSTGSLGFRIAESFAESDSVEKIFLLHGRNAKVPENRKVIARMTGGVEDVIAAIHETVTNNHIDAIIHCMAVSDYGVDAAFSSGALANCIAKKFYSGELHIGAGDESGLADRIEDVINGFEGYSSRGKIRSDVKHLMINMGRTPKIINIFKEFSPKPVIVGFKLLTGVPKAELIDVAHALLVKNECDFVLANDLTSISGENHIGYLIDKDRNEKEFHTKKEIAQGICRAVLTLLQAKQTEGKNE